MKSKLPLSSGFTLIELMIVVAIIGVLAAISIAAYQNYVARSQISEALTLIAGVKKDIADIWSSKATCPDNSNAETLGIPKASDIKGRYVDSITSGGTTTLSGGCTVTALMKNTDVAGPISGKKVRLTLTNADKGSLVWACTSDAENEYLPATCRSNGNL